MTRESLWTREAEASFHSVLAFLESEWGHLVADAFASDVEHTIALLEVFPNGGVIEIKDIRSIPVARQVRLFYSVSEEQIIVLEFIDTRSGRFQGIRE